MAHKITIELSDEDLKRIEHHAKLESLSIPEFIAVAALRYVDQNELIDEFELVDILEKENLLE
ncbi:MAG: ribbon-helix-helix protein, CopG family [Spirochaetia bacterium]|nr:ribbon-helix-helix protein, CopG family [Spirochaetia bacterium]